MVFSQCGLSRSIEAALPLRHDAFEAQLTSFGEHDRALGDERFAEQDSIEPGYEGGERAAPGRPA